MAARTDISAVIWDFGGVFTSSPFEAFNRATRLPTAYQGSDPQDQRHEP